MAQSAEESSKVAFYENVADNENAVPELRVLSARKANWLRIIARLQATGFQARPNPSNPQTSIDREALLFSPTRLAAARTNNDVTGYQKRLSVTSSQQPLRAKQQNVVHRVGRLFRSQLRSARALG
jgi:hypothetical protein